jgi:hypothetical protein
MQVPAPRLRRAATLGFAALLAAASVAAPAMPASASSGEGEGEEAPVDPEVTEAPPESTLGVVTTTLPPGCPEPPAAAAVFLGEVVASDTRTARFRVDQIRAGSLEGWQVGGLVDVDYFDDTRYLESGETYLVGVGPDPETRRLTSKVSEAAPLFGGNQVVGVNDSATCPAQQDPIRTIHPDGSSVESGILHPLVSDKQGLARALLLPASWVFLALVVLATVKGLLVGGGRELVRAIRGERRIRDEDIWRDAGYDDE